MLGLENSKAKRIKQIYDKLLQAPLGLSITELSEALSVSTKTIQRDLYEVLSEYGVIRDGRKWRIDHSQMQDFGDEELIASILEELAKNSGSTLYTKAKSLLSRTLHGIHHPIFANIPSEKLDEGDLQNFKMIEKAIKSKNEVGFVYEGKNFIAKPIKLAFFDGFWYLLALDSGQKDTFKKFHFKSIKMIEILSTHFEIPFQIEEYLKQANSIWFSLSDAFDVQLHIHPSMKKYFLRKPFIGQKSLGEESDGSIIIEVSVTHEMEILPIIYGYIPFIKVLSPEWLRKEVKRTIKAYAKEL
ncbi:helix-turn-helix transcriptional regulator [Helicobacter pametensis]|uniref:helix-turn-helix transcriptional regulator n=1 Tax=Helicobacter pametensis TaxID=95149 RepID=UPI00048173DA|nr:WYL domain-containing protein [Helicobacter pametensis]